MSNTKYDAITGSGIEVGVRVNIPDELIPSDALQWLGITRIHRFVSMSDMKYDAITGSGIEVGERVDIPDELIPPDARVEIDAKMAAGYFTDGAVPDEAQLAAVKGRGLE